MPSLSTKERKPKFNTDDLIFRKKCNLSSYFDNEYKYKLFGTKSKRTINSSAPSKKYKTIEEFKDGLRDLKNILNEIKITGTIERTRNK